MLGEGLEPLSVGEEPLSLGVESVEGCLVMSEKQTNKNIRLRKSEEHFDPESRETLHTLLDLRSTRL